MRLKYGICPLPFNIMKMKNLSTLLTLAALSTLASFESWVRAQKEACPTMVSYTVYPPVADIPCRNLPAWCTFPLEPSIWGPVMKTSTLRSPQGTNKFHFRFLDGCNRNHQHGIPPVRELGARLHRCQADGIREECRWY